MSPRTRLLCSDAELAVECAHAAEAVGLAVDPVVVPDPTRAAGAAMAQGERVGVAVVHPPPPSRLLELAAAARKGGVPGLLAIVGPDPEDGWAIHPVAGDLGLVAVREVRPLLAALAVTGIDADVARGSLRSLTEVDRVRLASVVEPATPAPGRLVPLDGSRVGWQTRDEDAPVALGHARDVRDALAAMAQVNPDPWATAPPIPGLDPQLVDDILLGPARRLSDPTSKSALAPYGLPMPEEELCSSPSRTAAEAQRIGFPVRLALASPDLRLWDHPELVVDAVDSASKARDGYRQLVAMAAARSPDARVLGVTVSAASLDRVRLWVQASSLAPGRVLARLGFADPHGRAASDDTTTVLPATTGQVARVLARLRGAPLLLDGSASALVPELTDVLIRLAAFVDDRRDEVESVELRPLVVLLGSGVEVRGARVSVGDYYESRLRGDPRPSAPAPP